MNTPELQLDTANIGRAQPGSAPAPDTDSDTASLSAKDLNVSMAIGAEDVVEGKIRVGKNKTLVVRGIVNGEIISQGQVIILPGARVLGKITAAALTTEGDIGDAKNPAQIEVGNLLIGTGSRTIADCVYDTMSVLTPNRGVRGQMLPREEMESRDA